MEQRSIVRVQRAVREAVRASQADFPAPILVGLSGGPDSVALLHALLRLRFACPELKFDVVAAHLNHRLRGAESDRDEGFVRALCEREGVQLIVDQANDLNPLRANIEERARDSRYEFLNRAADRLGARLIATAHHADDQAETVLLRLLRGSGATGLGAIAATGPGRLIRPLLALTRKEILDYLRAVGADYVTDSTNSSTTFLRNRVRSELIPMLESDYAPGLSHRLADLAREMRELDDFVTDHARAELAVGLTDDGRLSLAAFSNLPPALGAAVLREFVRDCIGNLRHIRRDHIEAMRRLCISNEAGSNVVGLPQGWTFGREYGYAMLARDIREELSPFTIGIKPHGTTIVEPAQFSLSLSTIETSNPGSNALCWKTASGLEAYFDADEIGPLVARSFERGDHIRVFGKGGRRKVQDIFVDKKLPAKLRSRWPLVVCNGEIVWIPKLVRSSVATVTSRTQKVLYLRATPCANRASLSLLGN
jgi:tRNA(Ile)-lysidine synthase